MRRTAHDDVRDAAAWVLERTLGSRTPLDTSLASARARCDERDHALLLDLVLGSLRWLRRLDQAIAAASNRALDQIEPPLRACLRIAAYQLLFLDREPGHMIEEAVQRAHCLTHRGGASFVNGVLRRLARGSGREPWRVQERDPVRRLAIELSHPEFLVERWLHRLGRTRTVALLKANNQAPPPHLLAFRDRGGRELLAECLIDEGVDLEAGALSPLGLRVRRGDPAATDAYRRGDFDFQDEGRQAAALIPRPVPGEEVLDAVTGWGTVGGWESGGASLALAGWEPAIRCTLLGVSLAEAAAGRRNFKRLGRTFSTVIAETTPLAGARGFDRVIVDLPGSATGALARHPEIKWRLREEDIGRLAAQGLTRLANLAPQVKPAGHLVAVSTSLEPEENEDLIREFLSRHPDFVPLPLEDVLAPPLEAAIADAGLWRLAAHPEHGGVTVHVLKRR